MSMPVLITTHYFCHLWQIEGSSSFEDDSAEEEEGEGEENEGGNLAAILFSNWNWGWC